MANHGYQEIAGNRFVQAIAVWVAFLTVLATVDFRSYSDMVAKSEVHSVVSLQVIHDRPNRRVAAFSDQGQYSSSDYSLSLMTNQGRRFRVGCHQAEKLCNAHQALQKEGLTVRIGPGVSDSEDWLFEAATPAGQVLSTETQRLRFESIWRRKVFLFCCLLLLVFYVTRRLRTRR